MPVLAQTENLASLFRKAHAAHQNGALAQAEKYYRALLARDPDHFDALHLLGFLHFQRGRWSEALRFLGAALKRNGNSAQAWCNHGLVLHALRRCDGALASYDAGLRLDPKNPDLLNKRGIALLDLGRAQAALEDLDRALAINPAMAEALGNRGNALIKLNRPQEAIASYDAARALAGDNAALLTNRAHALRRLDRLHDAIADLGKAIAINPNFAEAHFERGLAELSLGDFRSGWDSYEWRWQTNAFTPHRRDFTSPIWSGDQALHGKTILLHAEQGLGDTIQFVRYVPQLAQLGASIVLEVEPELLPLMSGVEGVTRLIARGEKLPRFDFHCPLMSLPRAFKTDIATIPAGVPYLKAGAKPTWARDLADGKPRVGVVWAGRASHHNDVNRSIALSRFAPLFDVATVQFVSLQRELGEPDAAVLRDCNVLCLGSDLTDFADTAALVSQLDLVVCVDTAVAHLAGALGKPVTILLPAAADFRWLRQREDSPWYPTAKLIRQPSFGDWDSVIERVRHELAAWCAAARKV